MLVIHASDLHLGRPLGALPRHASLELAHFQHSAYRTLHRLVDLCLNEHADFLLLAGDLLEAPVRDYTVGLRLIRELSRLEDAGTRVAWVRGNHDAENRVIANLLLPAHVFELGLSGVETRRFEDAGLALVGASYRERACCENLLASYPARHHSLCTIGLLHTSGDGEITDDSYAPCRRSDLIRQNYAYFALGHVHEPTYLAPNVAYCGCLQGRSFFESGPRGCLLVQFDGGLVTSVTHRSLEVARFGLVTVDVEDATNLDDIVEASNRALLAALRRLPNRALVVRFRLSGAAGAEILLSTHVATRHRALHSVACGCAGRVAIDGFWVDVGQDEVARFRVDDDALIARCDVA